MNWNKAFNEHRMNYYRLHVPTGPISNRPGKLSDLMNWLTASGFDKKAKLFILGQFDDNECIIFIKTDQTDLMTSIAKTLTIFEFHPTEQDVEKAYCLLG